MIRIIYHSNYGQTRKIAHRIADSLTDAGHTARALNVMSIDESHFLDHCDAMIFGAPIYSEKHSVALGKLIALHREKLKKIVTAFFSVSLAASGNQQQRTEASQCMDQFLDELHWKPDHKTIFAGGLPWREYNWFVRWTMKRVVKKAGGDTDTSKNQEYTDWEAVDEFSNQILQRLETMTLAKVAS